MTSVPAFHAVFQRRWAVPILADLSERRGSKLVTITNHLGGSRDSIRNALDLLETLGLVLPNPGHGHPMRPEYVLTDRGLLVSKPSLVLVKTLHKLDSADLGLKRWSMPAMHAIGGGAARFNEIAAALRSATDRAVSLALHDLHDSAMIGRTLHEGRPPHNVYALTRPAGRLTPILADFAAALD